MSALSGANLQHLNILKENFDANNLKIEYEKMEDL
jgi:hypothetical protein